MDKLKYIRVQQQDGTYSSDIPIAADAQNISMRNGNTLQNTIGSLDIDSADDITTQLSNLTTATNQLNQQKVNHTDLSNYIDTQLTNDVTSWLDTNVTPAGSTVMVDESLSIGGAAADAKVTGNKIENIKNWARLDGVQIISGNLYNSNVDRGDGAYYYENGEIHYTNYTSYKWYKIPVESNTYYYSPIPVRWYYTTDINNNVISSGSYEGSSAVTINTGIGAAYMTINYNFINYSTPSIYMGETIPNNINTTYLLPNSIKIENNAINGMLNAGGNTYSHNIFSSDYLYASEGYVDIDSNGKLIIVASTNYNSYIMPVDGSEYNFTNCRTAVLLAEDKYTAIDTTKTYITKINTNGASFIAFSFNPTEYPVNKYIVKKLIKKVFVPSNWVISNNNWKKNIIETTGSFNSGGGLEIKSRTAIKDGQVIVFNGDFSTFSSITLAFCTSDVQHKTNYFTINNTSIVALYDAGQPQTVEHGLSILNDIMVICKFENGKAKLSIRSNGNNFDNEYTWYQRAATVTYPAIISNGSSFTYSKLSIINNCTKRNIWFFGDSYITFNQDTRYPYYLNEDGYINNVLFNGSGGLNSGYATVAFQHLLQFGTPEFAIIATGMNDGTDSDINTPNTNWVTYKNQFLALCQNNGIIPIFCTIPTVPSINNEGKNSWIRSSNYRYIDFAKSVGANSSGTWYDGMLSGDNIHPSVKGAKALYSQLLIDFPEIIC